MVMRGRDLIYEDEPLPTDPVDEGEPTIPTDNLSLKPFTTREGVRGFLDTYSVGEVYPQNKEIES